MLLEDDLRVLLSELSARVAPVDLLAGARRRHGRRRALRLACSVAAVAVLATGTTVTIARSRPLSHPAVLRTGGTPPPAVAAGDAYASVEQGTHDLILISADTGVHTVLHHTAAGDPVPVTAVVSPSRRYVYYLTMDPTASRSATTWRIPIDGGGPQKLPSGPHAGPDGQGGLGISPADLVVSPDDTEYAYPAFDRPEETYVQQVSGGRAVAIGSASGRVVTPLGWLDDDRLITVTSETAPAALLTVEETRVSRRERNGAGIIVDAHAGPALPEVGALLANGRVVVSDLVGRAPTARSRLVTLHGEPAQATLETWSLPASLTDYRVLDITPLPDGRALVRFDNGRCGARPLPTVIYSPDGSYAPAYAGHASALHC